VLAGSLVLLLAGTATAYLLDSSFPGGREYEADHYYATEVEADLRRAVDAVPAGASFGGTRRVVPHLAARRELYQFPFTFYNPPLRPDSQRPEYYLLDLTDSPTRRAVEPDESDSVLEKRPRYHVRRFGPSILLLSKSRPEPLVARGDSFGGQVRLNGLDWLGPDPTDTSRTPTTAVRLYWEALVRSPSDAVRVLRLRAPDGAVLAELAGQPLDEYLPLRDWDRGQVVVEELRPEAPPELDLRGARLTVSWQRPDGQPLPVDGSGAGEVELARFERP
jgi:hypothetical protein